MKVDQGFKVLGVIWAVLAVLSLALLGFVVWVVVALLRHFGVV